MTRRSRRSSPRRQATAARRDMLYIDGVRYRSRTTLRASVACQSAILLLLGASLAAAQANPAAQAARQWRQQHERAIVDELVTLLAVPDVSSDKPNIQRNADLIAKMI